MKDYIKAPETVPYRKTDSASVGEGSPVEPKQPVFNHAHETLHRAEQLVARLSVIVDRITGSGFADRGETTSCGDVPSGFLPSLLNKSVETRNIIMGAEHMLDVLEGELQ